MFDSESESKKAPVDCESASVEPWTESTALRFAGVAAKDSYEMAADSLIPARGVVAAESCGVVTAALAPMLG